MRAAPGRIRGLGTSRTESQYAAKQSNRTAPLRSLPAPGVPTVSQFGTQARECAPRLWRAPPEVPEPQARNSTVRQKLRQLWRGSLSAPLPSCHAHHRRVCSNQSVLATDGDGIRMEWFFGGNPWGVAIRLIILSVVVGRHSLGTRHRPGEPFLSSADPDSQALRPRLRCGRLDVQVFPGWCHRRRADLAHRAPDQRPAWRREKEQELGSRP